MRRLAFLLGITFLSAIMAHADIITQTLGRPDHVPPGSYTMAFNRFDTSLGTLTSVQIILSLSIYDGFLKFDNDSEEEIVGTATLGAAGGLTSTDVTLSNGSVNPWASVQSSVSEAFDLAVNESGESTVLFNEGGLDYGELIGPNELTPVQTGVNDYVAAAFWGAYQGAGTFDVHFVTTQVQQLLSGGIQAQVSAAHSFGAVTVVYNYTPVPEPATASLASLAVLMLLRRRRR